MKETDLVKGRGIQRDGSTAGYRHRRRGTSLQDEYPVFNRDVDWKPVGPLLVCEWIYICSDVCVG